MAQAIPIGGFHDYAVCVLKRIVDFEVAPPIRKDSRALVALGTSAILHTLILLFVIFGIPVSSGSAPGQSASAIAPQPIALRPPSAKARPLPKQDKPPAPEAPKPPPPPPPPMQEVELGPDSKKPDAPAKEAAAKPAVADIANPANAKRPDPTNTPPATDQPKPPEAQPAAPQRIQVPRPGDYTGAGQIPIPSTSPWGPPKLDSASGAPPSEMAATSTSAMGRAGLTNTDPKKWENSFDNETAGRCVAIPDLGKNSDGSPVLASVIGRILDTDGRSPMPGAHLQIMGTQFGTFTGNNGEYRLDFDPHLLEKCRVQYVTVVAPGYRLESLKLSIGPRVRSDDVILRKH